MATIYLGPTQKNLGISWNQIFTGTLPVSSGDFPQHIKDAVAANPAMEHQFRDIATHAEHKPAKPSAVKVAAAAPKSGPPIKTITGLKKSK